MIPPLDPLNTAAVARMVRTHPFGVEFALGRLRPHLPAATYAAIEREVFA